MGWFRESPLNPCTWDEISLSYSSIKFTSGGYLPVGISRGDIRPFEGISASSTPCCVQCWLEIRILTWYSIHVYLSRKLLYILISRCIQLLARQLAASSFVNCPAASGNLRLPPIKAFFDLGFYLQLIEWSFVCVFPRVALLCARYSARLYQRGHVLLHLLHMQNFFLGKNCDFPLTTKTKRPSRSNFDFLDSVILGGLQR